MTVVLLSHPKINCMTIPPLVPVNSFRTIPPCGNFAFEEEINKKKNHFFMTSFNLNCPGSLARANYHREE
jgi:hypothetical protein